MGRSFDDLVADNQVAAETYAYRCLVEFRLLAGPESEVRFGWSDGGQTGWCVVRASTTLSRRQRNELKQRGWRNSRWNVGANYDGGYHTGWRGWSKEGDDFDLAAIVTDEEVGTYFAELRETEAYLEDSF